MIRKLRLNENKAYNDFGVRCVGCLEDYVDIIMEVAGYYGIPVLDMHRVSGLQPEDPDMRQRYMPDGLHPNDAGHAVIAQKLKDAGEDYENGVLSFLKTDDGKLFYVDENGEYKDLLERVMANYADARKRAFRNYFTGRCIRGQNNSFKI